LLRAPRYVHERARQEADAPERRAVGGERGLLLGAAFEKIVRDARASDYRFSSLIVGITNSMPFQMRRAE